MIDGSILQIIQMRNFTHHFIFRLLLSTLVNDDSEQRPNGDLPSLHKFSAHRAYWGQKLQDSQEQLVGGEWGKVRHFLHLLPSKQAKITYQ